MRVVEVSVKNNLDFTTMYISHATIIVLMVYRRNEGLEVNSIKIIPISFFFNTLKP